MNDPQAPQWPACQRLANEYPDCNGVKLTLELQRRCIAVQQQQFLRRVTSIARLPPELSSI